MEGGLPEALGCTVQLPHCGETNKGVSASGRGLQRPRQPPRPNPPNPSPSPSLPLPLLDLSVLVLTCSYLCCSGCTWQETLSPNPTVGATPARAHLPNGRFLNRSSPFDSSAS